MFMQALGVHAAYTKANSFYNTVTALTPLLRELGYKKVNYTWHKNKQGVTILFSVMRDSPQSITWKYGFGIGIEELSQTRITKIKHCQLQQIFRRSRYGYDWAVHELVAALDYWEQQYGSLRALNTAAIRNTLPPNTPPNVIKHCEWIDCSKYDEQQT